MERVWLREPVTSMPPGLFHLLQGVRTGLLKLATPADTLLGKVRRLEARPPLWLRRQVGALRNLESSSREMAEFIRTFRLVRPGDCVLDVGCGTGVMASELAALLGPRGRYVGFDVNPAAIRWCREALAGDQRLTFELAVVNSPYGSAAAGPVEEYRFPVRDGEAGFVIAKSLFTHLLEAHARHYLRELRRSLAPGRAAVLTAFLFGEGSLADRGRSPIFPFGEETGRVRWRWKARPEAAVAYRRDAFEGMLADAGLRIGWFAEGFFPGDASHFSGQDILVVG